MTAHLNVMRRGFVLITVLVIVGSALLVATGLLFLAQSSSAAVSGAEDAAQSRALVWSGVQVVMVELDKQRDTILEGRLPRLKESYEIFRRGEGTGVVRLLPVTERGAVLAPQAAKLDVNHIDAARLAATTMVDDQVARAIIDYRQKTLRRPFQSVAELLLVDGVTPELLYGPIDLLSVSDPDAGDPDARPRGLADVITVYAVEPALQGSGDLRINLNATWSDELAGRIDDRFGAGASDLIRNLFNSGVTFEDDSRIYETLLQLDVDLEQWPEIVDAFTTDKGQFHFGRLDLNRASYEALLGLPEMTPDVASQIVQAQGELSAQEQATVVWPVQRGLVPKESYPALAGTITTRSSTYRLRLAAGEVDDDDPDAALVNPVIYEVVIDCASPRARLGYLRDITHLDTTLQIASVMTVETAAEELLDDDDPDDDADVDDEPEAEPKPEPKPQPEPTGGDEIEADPAPVTDETASPADPGTVETAGQRVGRWLPG